MGEQYFNKVSIEKRIAELKARKIACSIILKDYNFWEALNKKTEQRKK